MLWIENIISTNSHPFFWLFPFSSCEHNVCDCVFFSFRLCNYLAEREKEMGRRRERERVNRERERGVVRQREKGERERH